MWPWNLGNEPLTKQLPPVNDRSQRAVFCKLEGLQVCWAERWRKLALEEDSKITIGSILDTVRPEMVGNTWEFLGIGRCLQSSAGLVSRKALKHMHPLLRAWVIHLLSSLTLGFPGVNWNWNGLRQGKPQWPLPPSSPAHSWDCCILLSTPDIFAREGEMLMK